MPIAGVQEIEVDRLKNNPPDHETRTNRRIPLADNIDNAREAGKQADEAQVIESCGPKSPMKKSKSSISIANSDLEIKILLGQAVSDISPFPTNRRKTLPALPPLFRQEIERLFTAGRISTAVMRYYLDVLPRGDSQRVPGQNGRPSCLDALLTEDVHNLTRQDAPGSGWRPIRIIGKGAYGCVILWERPQREGLPLCIASKNTICSTFFKDYCAEGHLTRRLNDTGCPNVIRALEWKYVGGNLDNYPDGTPNSAPPRHRICYEYAHHSDLQRLELWYKKQGLIFPEAFLWHVLFGVANALCYCRHGTNTMPAKPGWDAIVHGDVKQANVFLTVPDRQANPFYPTVKLADFGLAYTIGGSTMAVQHYRSLATYGTDGYMAPEIETQSPEQVGRRRLPHELHGPHSDIFSLGMTCKHLVSLVDVHASRPSDQRKSDSSSSVVQSSLQNFYSTELRSLLERCTSHDARERPKTSRLLQEAKTQMFLHQRMMETEAAAARWECNARFYHSQVLYSTEDQARFESDHMFRNNYRRANLSQLSALAEAEQPKLQGRPSLSQIASSDGERTRSKQVERFVRALLGK